jgi:hypothetical protein
MVTSDDPPPTDASGTLSWRSLPLVDDYPKSLLLAPVSVVVCVLAGVAFGGWWAAALAGVFLLISMSRYVLPTYFRLDDSGVTARFLGHVSRMPWSDVQRLAVSRVGVHLSPFKQPSRLDSFRGMLLRFAANADEVTRFAKDNVLQTE